MENMKMRNDINILKELGNDWKKNLSIMNNLKGDKEIKTHLNRLFRKNNQSNLIKMGLTLIAFPFPIVIDDVLGLSLLAAGLIQKKVKDSALYYEDLNHALPSILKELKEIM